jgi:hypothetical protein
MKRLNRTIFLAATLASASAIAAAQAGECNTGRLRDVQVNTGLIDAGTAEHGEERTRKSGREYYGYSTPLTQQQTIYTVTVQFDDMIYTAQSQSIFGFGFKPTSFIVNDPIHGCVRGNTLALTRQDGKEFKAHIVRAERETPPKP